MHETGRVDVEHDQGRATPSGANASARVFSLCERRLAQSRRVGTASSYRGEPSPGTFVHHFSMPRSPSGSLDFGADPGFVTQVPCSYLGWPQEIQRSVRERALIMGARQSNNQRHDRVAAIKDPAQTSLHVTLWRGGHYWEAAVLWVISRFRKVVQR